MYLTCYTNQTCMKETQLLNSIKNGACADKHRQTDRQTKFLRKGRHTKPRTAK